jgi:hypothetical protein
MKVTIDQLLAIIGGKDVEMFLLKSEIEELRKRLSEAEAKLAESTK